MPEFGRASKGLLSDEERMDLLTQIASDPEQGEVIPETGGLRKTRVPLAGRGKRSGARVIYAFFGNDIPVFVFTCYPKNKKANLSPKEKQTFRKLLPRIVEEYKKGITQRITKQGGLRYGKESREKDRVRA